MKRASLNGIKKINKNSIDTDYIDEEVIQFLESEGFEFSEDNNGYYTERYTPKELKRATPCYKNRFNEINGYDIFIYIDSNGIGIDQDFSCGGKFHSYHYAFKEYNTFADTYNKISKVIKNVENL